MMDAATEKECLEPSRKDANRQAAWAFLTIGHLLQTNRNSHRQRSTTVTKCWEFSLRTSFSFDHRQNDRFIECTKTDIKKCIGFGCGIMNL